MFNNNIILLLLRSIEVLPGVRIRIEEPARPGIPAVEDVPGDLTGLRVWPTTVPLTRYVRRHLLLPRSRVLELGAGCGCLGIGLAAAGARVVLTDPAVPLDGGATTLDVLASNVEMNRGVVGRRASARRLVWGSDEDFAALRSEFGAFDLVVGSEVVYNPASFDALAATLRAVGTLTAFGYPSRFGKERGLFDRLESDFEIRETQLPDNKDSRARLCLLSPRRRRRRGDDDVFFFFREAPATPLCLPRRP